MTKEELRQEYENETGKSHGNVLFSTTEYACWLEKRIEALSIANVVGRGEQLKEEVFTLVNKLAVAGEGDAAVAMHRIHNCL